MSSFESTASRVRDILEGDRVWCAYALADLEPPYAEQSRWILGIQSVGLVYGGLVPPLFFFQGDPAEIEGVVDSIDPAPIQYGLLPTHRSRLETRLRVEREAKMWRMAFHGPLPTSPIAVRRMGVHDVPAIRSLFRDHADRPDSFHPNQVRDGIFFGVEHGDELVSVAGTHVIGRRGRVAAIGNVFTRPDRRHEGLGAAACIPVVQALLEAGIKTIVLNVGMDNAPALSLYAALGFLPFCGYYEGQGRLERPRTGSDADRN
ncbi:MAG TPA: GNAT family N-acetyltransferase [Anaerolineales bacterium]|nr:GNAT family N-acetyltransferase [Anaerolineales bacterium]